MSGLFEERTFGETKLIRVPLDSKEADDIMQFFYKSTETSGMEEFQRKKNIEVYAIHIVENMDWEKHWSVSTEKWNRKGYRIEVVIHGTEEEHLPSIMEVGPDVGYSKRAAYGKGFYGTEIFDTAKEYGSVYVTFLACLGKIGVDKGRRDESPKVQGYDTTSAEKGKILCIASPFDQMIAKAVVWTRYKCWRPEDLVGGGAAAASSKAPAAGGASSSKAPATGGASSFKAPVAGGASSSIPTKTTTSSPVIL
jgi:hypothetical protein